MIVSYHPIIEAHENIICAGRRPNDDDLAAIKRARAVILPQGCSKALYRMARRNCPHVFPNLDVRFDFHGKRGQIQLFEQLGEDYPKTQSYDSVAAAHQSRIEVEFPAVVKFDWGGQGETVFKVDYSKDLADVLRKAETFEKSGQFGFLIQEFIPTRRRSLRVVVIGSRLISYWRLQSPDQPFGGGVADGAAVDALSALQLQNAGRSAAKRFCRYTGLQLAGFDYIFDKRDGGEDRIRPLILEINYFFGRTGLGGSDKYYSVLRQEVDKWLARINLAR